MPIRELVRADLCREARFELRATEDPSGDGLTIDGIAAVFDTPTRIDSWEGTFDEQIAFGAFNRSIRSKMPKLQFDHGHHPLIGSLPIGSWTSMREERGVGLHAVGRLHDNWLVEPVRDAISEGSVDGMSFRFSVVDEVWRDNTGKVLRDEEELLRLLWNPGDRGPLQRTLREVKISEAGPVVWPAYQETSVGVRSKTVTIDLGRLDDPEQRKQLAHAVFLADAANRNTDGPQESTEDAPGTHASARSDAPQATADSPGEHPSNPPRENPLRLKAKSIRGYLDEEIRRSVRRAH